MTKKESTPVEKLFGSKTRAKLLSLFFTNPRKTFYVREITRVIGEQINSVRRELTNLETIGVIKNETYDNKVYYSANLRHPFNHPLQEIFTSNFMASEKNSDIRTSTWQEYIRPVSKQLKALVVTNKLPGQDGIDMLIIGNDNAKKLTRWAEVVEKKQGKPLNYTIMSRDDFMYRKRVRDSFLNDIFEMEILEIIDPDHIIKEQE